MLGTVKLSDLTISAPDVRLENTRSSSCFSFLSATPLLNCFAMTGFMSSSLHLLKRFSCLVIRRWI